MAEVAIPILALGAMYLINNDGNRRKNGQVVKQDAFETADIFHSVSVGY